MVVYLFFSFFFLRVHHLRSCRGCKKLLNKDIGEMVVTNVFVTGQWPLTSAFTFYVYQVRFAELFGQDAAAESRRSQERFRNGLLVGMSLAAGIAIGSLIVRKLL